MKIGIMGGTFYPIHNGHLMLAEHAFRQFCLDKIWFMPNKMPPHKSDREISLMTEHRVEMIRRAIADHPEYELQLYEIEHTTVSYSYKTLEHFQTAYPDDEFYFIIGADSLFMFDTWVHPERIAATCVILAAFRDGASRERMKEQIASLNQRYNGDFRLLDTPYLDVSSTEIRRCERGVRDKIPESVWSYMKEHRLFWQETESVHES